MINADFMRFFNEVIAPAQATAAEAFPKTPAPDGVSEEAKFFIENDKGPSPPVDVFDPPTRAMVRNLINAMWLSIEPHLGIEHTSVEEPIAGVPCKTFTPKTLKNTKQKILYLHGGAYWLGSAEANSSVALSLADKTGLEVISADYRLAPEHPCPAALEDAVTVYKALLASGIAPKNISIAGKSAGGGLALSTAQEIVRIGLPKPAAIGLIAPWTDLTFSGDSHKENNMCMDTRLSVEGLTGAAKAYAGKLALTNPQVSPLFAKFVGLPPMLVQVGSREILLSDATRLETKARTAGVDVTLNVYEGMWHVWQFYPHIPEATEALQEMADFFGDKMG
ncbi:MAG: alpha/beta hydrolase [Kordiimonas sp.]